MGLYMFIELLLQSIAQPHLLRLAPVGAERTPFSNRSWAIPVNTDCF